MARALLQRCARGGIDLARLSHNNKSLGAGCAVGSAKHSNASLPNTFDFRDGLFDLLRIEVAARSNDNVFDPAGYVNLAVRFLLGPEPLNAERRPLAHIEQAHVILQSQRGVKPNETPRTGACHPRNEKAVNFILPTHPAAWHLGSSM